MSKIPAVIAALCVIACGNDSPLEPLAALPHAVATPSCGPTDAPITLIYLASTPVELPQPVSPFVQAHVPKAFGELTSGEVFPVGESFEDAMVWFYRSGIETKLATRGEVGITAVNANNISGYVDLRFDDGTILRGSFNAQLQPRTMLCG